MPIKYLFSLTGHQRCTKALRSEDEGVERRGKKDNLLTVYFLDQVGTGGEVPRQNQKSVQGSMSLALADVATTDSECWASAEKTASQQLEVSPGFLGALRADLNLLVESWVLAPAP